MSDKRQKRKKQTAEDFTPSWLTNQMLDKLNEYGPESWEEGKTFLDPACGNGNMLIEVLKRKIELGHDPFISLKSIYGVDIMGDNIRECRLRLLKIMKDNGVDITIDMIKATFNNIVVTRLSRFKNGSLDYDFKFRNTASTKDAQAWLDGIDDGWLDDINSVSGNDLIDISEPEKDHSILVGGYRQSSLFDD